MKTAVELYGEISAGLTTAIVRAKTVITVHQYDWQKENAERELKEFEKAESSLSEAYYRLCDLEYAAGRLTQYAIPVVEFSSTMSVVDAEITPADAEQLEAAIEAEDFAEANAMNDIAVLTCGDAG